jgi:hypothetical protein
MINITQHVQDATSNIRPEVPYAQKGNIGFTIDVEKNKQNRKSNK